MVPVLLAVPWLLQELRYGNRVREHAFALAAMLAIVGCVLFTALAWSDAGLAIDERYIMYAAPPILIAAFLVVDRKEYFPSV